MLPEMRRNRGRLAKQLDFQAIPHDISFVFNLLFDHLQVCTRQPFFSYNTFHNKQLPANIPENTPGRPPPEAPESLPSSFSGRRQGHQIWITFCSWEGLSRKFRVLRTDLRLFPLCQTCALEKKNSFSEVDGVAQLMF